MFELTNAQRLCFGLLPVEAAWVRLEPPNRYPERSTIAAYLDGNVVRKMVEVSDRADYITYYEKDVCVQLSDDLRYILPKGPKGKPAKLTAAALSNRPATGMYIFYHQHTEEDAWITLANTGSEQLYYSSHYDPVPIRNMADFQQWAEKWRADTTPEDMEELTRFIHRPRQHVKYREGDVFRFKLNRRLYGYGHILLNYDLMRKRKEPFWDAMMAKPLACSIYHIATERADVTVDELKKLPSLPSVHVWDNEFYYGGYEIIGHIPIQEKEDYPILYGNSFDVRCCAELLQCGKLYRCNEGQTALFRDFVNGHPGSMLHFGKLDMLLKCIEEKSNAPYWAQKNKNTQCDLRNPKFRTELEQVCKRFDLTPAQLLKEMP